MRECYERNLTQMAGCSPGLRQVNALMAAHDFFQMVEGPHSARVHLAIEYLLSSELRPGLRDWCRHANGEINAAAIVFRDHLNSLAGEKLEREEDLPANPS